MTATPTTRPRPKRKPRPQGQWLVDGTTPLNDDEKIKQEDVGLGVIDRIRETYAKQGFDSIPQEYLETSTIPLTPTTRPRPTRKPRTQGQWLVDGTTPLNDDEKIKQEDVGLGVIDRIRETYAKQGFDSIPKEDLAPRFKWVGLYTQRRPGLDGVATSTLSTEELQ